MLKNIKIKHSSIYFITVEITLICFIFSLSSCTTTKTYKIDNPQTIKHDGTIEIQNVKLIDSTEYSFNENEAFYKKKYKDYNEIILFNSQKIIQDSLIKKISDSKYLMLLKDVLAIKYKRTYTSDKDVYYTLTGVGLTVIAIGCLILLIKSLFNGAWH